MSAVSFELRMFLSFPSSKRAGSFRRYLSLGDSLRLLFSRSHVTFREGISSSAASNFLLILARFFSSISSPAPTIDSSTDALGTQARPSLQPATASISCPPILCRRKNRTAMVPCRRHTEMGDDFYPVSSAFVAIKSFLFSTTTTFKT
jgi:hypothetical protein